MISRRNLLTASLALGAALFVKGAKAAAGQATFTDLEARHGGRLGVAVIDTGNGRVISHRWDERFALCSTAKFLIAAFVLARVDKVQESLDRRIVYGADALLKYSPVTEAHVGGDGLSVGDLCEAALTLSDNTAANLLLDSCGGPDAVTDYVRSLGDGATRLNRREPELNDVPPGDARDTTTPLAMAKTMKKIVLGDALLPPSRTQMAMWLVANKTGDKRLRAGLPKNWRIGDKTGTGNRGETNDIAVIWPPGRAPLIVTAYYAGSDASDDERSAALAEVGRVVAGI